MMVSYINEYITGDAITRMAFKWSAQNEMLSDFIQRLCTQGPSGRCEWNKIAKAGEFFLPFLIVLRRNMRKLLEFFETLFILD